ncbi:enoyl-CoA hydratase/isomerase family protein [Sphingomonas sp.]|uniref:enoyl-CoA hydratase/isomerase family protein n=1 Tax=Sphingomonas sp. TaxID=28214 RepID=UPI003D6D1091
MTDNLCFKNIRIERAERRATIQLNRPEKRNPLDWDTVRELRDAVIALEAEPGLMAVVVTGSGDAFSAGGDLEKYLTLFRSAPDFRGFMEDFYQLFRAIERSSAVYIAAINGVCVAGGLELLLACDIVIATENARIGDGHLNFGQLPGAGSSIRLWRSIGAHRAKHLMFTGDLLTARACERIGLVNEVHPGEDFDAAIETLVGKILAKSPVGLSGAKHLLNTAIREDLESGLRAEIEFVQNYATTERDPIEGLMAFKEKRKPNFGPQK